jgi:hypothetical protein
MLRHDPQGGWVEIPPTHCPYGHPLGPHRVLVTWQTDHEPHSRVWVCRWCRTKVEAERSSEAPTY